MSASTIVAPATTQALINEARLVAHRAIGSLAVREWAAKHTAKQDQDRKKTRSVLSAESAEGEHSGKYIEEENESEEEKKGEEGKKQGPKGEGRQEKTTKDEAEVAAVLSFILNCVVSSPLSSSLSSFSSSDNAREGRDTLQTLRMEKVQSTSFSPSSAASGSKESSKESSKSSSKSSRDDDWCIRGFREPEPTLAFAQLGSNVGARLDSQGLRDFCCELEHEWAHVKPEITSKADAMRSYVSICESSLPFFGSPRFLAWVLLPLYDRHDHVTRSGTGAGASPNPNPNPRSLLQWRSCVLVLLPDRFLVTLTRRSTHSTDTGGTSAGYLAENEVSKLAPAAFRDGSVKGSLCEGSEDSNGTLVEHVEVPFLHVLAWCHIQKPESIHSHLDFSLCAPQHRHTGLSAAGAAPSGNPDVGAGVDGVGGGTIEASRTRTRTRICDVDENNKMNLRSVPPLQLQLVLTKQDANRAAILLAYLQGRQKKTA
jgi:hypothetical protein